jgi:hypothetical protein
LGNLAGRFSRPLPAGLGITRGIVLHESLQSLNDLRSFF